MRLSASKYQDVVGKRSTVINFQYRKITGKFQDAEIAGTYHRGKPYWFARLTYRQFRLLELRDGEIEGKRKRRSIGERIRRENVERRNTSTKYTRRSLRPFRSES